MNKLWNLCNRVDINQMNEMLDEDSYKINFYFKHKPNDKLEPGKAAELEIFFRKQISTFVTDPECPWLDVETACRLSLSESTIDQIDYVQCAEDIPWVMEKVWFSVGPNGEKQEWYYASGEGEIKGYVIDLYTMTFRRISALRNRLGKMCGYDVLFGKTGISRAGNILALDSWCQTHHGMKGKGNVAIVRAPSPFASRFFSISPIVPVQDSTNECIRATVGSAIAVHMGLEAALIFCEREAEYERYCRIREGFPRNVWRSAPLLVTNMLLVLEYLMRAGL